MDGVEQTNESWRILIVEDDERLAELTREYLESNGLTVSLETHGGPAVERIRNEQPDLVVLDLMLPGEDGLSICRRVRPFYSGPIIMLTARTDDLDQVLGLEMGADDYIGKPVKPRVLLARIRAMLRRVTETGQSAGDEAGGEEPVRLQFNDLVVDRSMREAWLNDESIDLTSAEFDLLWLLASNAGRVLSRKRSSPRCAALSTMVRTVPLMFACPGFVPKSAMTPSIRGASRPFAAKATCS